MEKKVFELPRYSWISINLIELKNEKKKKKKKNLS